jgi:hypothetical protein
MRYQIPGIYFKNISSFEFMLYRIADGDIISVKGNNKSSGRPHE